MCDGVSYYDNVVLIKWSWPKIFHASFLHALNFYWLPYWNATLASIVFRPILSFSMLQNESFMNTVASSKNSALLIIRHPLPNDWKYSLIIWQRSSHVYAIYGNRMHAQMKCWILTSKSSAKLKQYYYFHAEFLEEVRYKVNWASLTTLLLKMKARIPPTISRITMTARTPAYCRRGEGRGNRETQYIHHIARPLRFFRILWHL